MTRHWPLARLLAAALALLVGVTFAAPPAQAAGPATGPISTAAAAQVAAMPNAQAAQAAQAAQPAAPATAQKPFIKTGKGALAFVLLAGALGMTFYSYSHDRVKSPAK